MNKKKKKEILFQALSRNACEISNPGDLLWCGLSHIFQILIISDLRRNLKEHIFPVFFDNFVC